MGYTPKGVWDDLRIVPGAFSFPGSADPVLRDFQPGGTGAVFKVYKFNQSDEAFASIQVPHAWKEGSTISVHIHWTPGDRGAAEDGKTVAWKCDYSWASIDGVFPASSTADMTDTCNGIDDRHELTPEIDIVATGKKISSMLMLRIYRDTGDTWAGTGTQAPALLELDFHIEHDSLGSVQKLIK